MYRIALSLLLIVFLAACASMVANLAVSTPVPNYVYLHAEPRVGDFANYQSLDRSQLMRIEVAGVDGEGANRIVLVRAYWPRAEGFAAGFLREHAYEFRVRANGEVIGAALLHRPTNTRRQVMPAGPGQIGYIHDPQLRPLTQPETAQFQTGPLTVNSVLMYEEQRQTAAGSQRITSTNFISHDVPFGLVRQINVLATEIKALDVAQRIARYAGAGNVVAEISGWLLGKMKRQRMEAGMELVAYGRASG